jgi:hypothetical protein
MKKYEPLIGVLMLAGWVGISAIVYNKSEKTFAESLIIVLGIFLGIIFLIELLIIRRNNKSK